MKGEEEGGKATESRKTRGLRRINKDWRGIRGSQTDEPIRIVLGVGGGGRGLAYVVERCGRGGGRRRGGRERAGRESAAVERGRHQRKSETATLTAFLSALTLS